ncbi:putative G-protein coupled receptor 148 [Aplochiton taeniatus]
MLNITEEWYNSLRSWHLQFFFIPTTLLTLAALLANPVLLACIFLSHSLRQETRYLLLANTLAADVLFLVLNLALVVSNALGLSMHRVLCELFTALSVTAYCCAILTVTLMVADTYVAVRWPLHYHDLLPPGRVRLILLGVWALASLYPLCLVVVMEVMKVSAHERSPVCLVLISLGFVEGENMEGVHVYFSLGATLCLALIVYCYARLYMITKTQGIWQSRYSRARVTLLAHGVLLLLYFVPGIVFTVELSLFEKDGFSLDLRVWMNTLNTCVFMLLPRVCAPYLYGLRYREISDTVLHLLHRRKRLGQVTVTMV